MIDPRWYLEWQRRLLAYQRRTRRRPRREEPNKVMWTITAIVLALMVLAVCLDHNTHPQ